MERRHYVLTMCRLELLDHAVAAPDVWTGRQRAAAGNPTRGCIGAKRFAKFENIVEYTVYALTDLQ